MELDSDLIKSYLLLRNIILPLSRLLNQTQLILITLETNSKRWRTLRHVGKLIEKCLGLAIVRIDGNFIGKQFFINFFYELRHFSIFNIYLTFLCIHLFSILSDLSNCFQFSRNCLFFCFPLLSFWTTRFFSIVDSLLVVLNLLGLLFVPRRIFILLRLLDCLIQPSSWSLSYFFFKSHQSIPYIP